MKLQKKAIISLGILALYVISIFSLAVASAQTTGSAIGVDADYITIFPGSEGKIDIDIENTNNFDIEDVSIELDLEDLPFTAVGSSTKDIDDLDEGDEDKASFTIKASNDIKTGDYSIPYVVRYTKVGETETLSKNGSFGISVGAKTELDFSIETKNNIISEKGTISLKIINSGLGDIKFISVELTPQGYELVSSKKVYVGTIASDDDDFATFDVIFKTQNPVLNAVVTYKDFENKDQTKNVNLPIKVYTEEEALQLGLIKKSNTALYIGISITLLILWFGYRKIKKIRKNKNKGR